MYPYLSSPPLRVSHHLSTLSQAQGLAHAGCRVLWIPQPGGEKVCVWTEVVQPRCTEQHLPTKLDTHAQPPCLQAIGDAVAKARAGAGAFFIAHDWVNQYQVCMLWRPDT
jgi:hypothetical protein